MFTSHSTLITGGTFTQYVKNRNIHFVEGSFEHLQEAASPAAFHNSGDRRDPPKCHPNTRVAVLEKIMNWILGLDLETRNALVMWLHGAAGSGKSAIAQTIAEWAFKEGILLASYFFSRFDPTRNHPRSLIATIAYQAASYFPRVRDCIMEAIDSDPLIFSRSLTTQIHTLIVDPLQSLTKSGYFHEPTSTRLVIIDGLDECEDRDGQVDILHTISIAFQEFHLPLIFLVASRPEHDIKTAFGLRYLRDITSRLSLDNKYQSPSDITLYLRDEFNNIKENHPFKAQIPLEWPLESILEKLVQKSSGQFIYAATVIKFVKSTRHRPSDRLDIVLGLRPAAKGHDMPFSELDALYRHVFSCVQDLEPVLQILAFRLLTKTRSANLTHWHVSSIEQMLSLMPGDIRLFFCDLHSVIDFLKLGSPERLYLRVLHASLEDFLLDESRSKELYINSPIRHAEFTQVLFPNSPRIEPHFKLETWAYHLARAQPNKKIRQAILNLDITNLFWRPAKERDTWGLIPLFLRSLNESQFVDAKELYLAHVQAFDKFVAQRLETYYLDKRLTVLVAIVSLPRLEGFQVISHDLFRLDKNLKSTDFYGLKLIRAMSSDAYHTFLLKIFADKTRLGIHAPDGTTYASGAIYFLEYFCGHLSQAMARHREREIRRNNPWKWRRRMVSRKHSDTCKGKISNSRWKYFDEMWRRDVQAYNKPVICRFSLQLLSMMLGQAGRSDELISLARKCNLWALSQAFPDETRITMQEVARYLGGVNMLDA